ncbi:MAG: hypothetical protein L6V81_09900 [Clostridium sp.]|nr:MAG: hypothetical protein L6V81_09900 [Clostridium sp.]
MKGYGVHPQNSIPSAELEEKRVDSLNNDGPVLRMNSNDRRFAGFTSKYLIAYIVIMTICLGIILGATVFKFIHR